MKLGLKTLLQLNFALNEVIRLRKQRRILASHLRYQLRVLRKSERLFGFMDTRLKEFEIAVLRVSEQRDHLASELSAEKLASRSSLQAMQADLEAARATAQDLDAKWREALEAQCQAIVERDEARAQLRGMEVVHG